MESQKKIVFANFLGVISYFSSYRAVYIAVSIVYCLFMIYIFLFVNNKQKKIQEQQLTCQNFYASNDSLQTNTKETESNDSNSSISDSILWLKSQDYQFPICIIQSDNYGVASDETDDSTVDQAKLSFADFSKVSGYEWFLLIDGVMQYSLIMANELIFITWYTVYMEDYYNANIIVSTSQLAIVCIFLIAGVSVCACLRVDA